MDIKRSTDVPAEAVETEGAVGVKIQWLVGAHDGPDNFFMRLFELEPGGRTPRHAHDWEHEVFVLAGEGSVSSEEANRPIGPESVVHIRPGEVHQFQNTGTETLRFLCLVPRSAGY
jgi:quercetin dioxygenase-like cupin family protein